MTNKRAFYLGICSGKGGVGKSTVSFLLAARLANAGYRTLILDADIGVGDIASLSNTSITHGFEELLTAHCDVHEAVIKISPRLWMVGTMPGFCLDNKMITIAGLRNCLTIDNDYDVVVIDTPCTLDKTFVNLLAATDLTITVINSSIAAVADSYIQLKKIVESADSLNYALVVNKIDSEVEGNRAAEKFSEMVVRFLDVEISLLGLIPEHSKIAKAADNQLMNELLNNNNMLTGLLDNQVKMLIDNWLGNTPSNWSIWKRLENRLKLNNFSSFDDRVMVAENRSEDHKPGNLTVLKERR